MADTCWRFCCISVVNPLAHTSASRLSECLQEIQNSRCHSLVWIGSIDLAGRSDDALLVLLPSLVSFPGLFSFSFQSLVSFPGPFSFQNLVSFPGLHDSRLACSNKKL